MSRTKRPRRESTTRLSGSRKAKQCAAVILEVFAGLRGAPEAGEALGVSPNRYYQLEARGLQGMIEALEPKPRGHQPTPQDEIAKLTMEKERLVREVGRLTSLVRASRRSLGITGASPAKSQTKAKSRSRRRGHRGKKVIAMLARPAKDGESDVAKAS
jgi:hypothetical protein